jgi:hypothetical protein
MTMTSSDTRPSPSEGERELRDKLVESEVSRCDQCDMGDGAGR